MTDIVDSKRYIELKNLHRQKHGLVTEFSIPFLTVCMNGDRVATFRLSNKSTYPVMIVINEICTALRGYNILVPLLFIATKEIPFHQKILTILVNELKELEQEGIQWENGPVTIETTYVYCYTLCLDAPVKSKILDIPGHSAKKGCPVANCEGVWVPKGKSGGVVWPSAECGPDRSSEDCGSLLNTIPAFKGTLFQSTSLDSLHGINIGPVKYLVNIIFMHSSNAQEKKLKEQRLKVADNLLRNISPPAFIERFRLLGTESAHFKAHEWRNFLFFYSMPIMLELYSTGLIEEDLVNHWFNFVLGVSLLNQEEISPNDISLATEALTMFVDSIMALAVAHITSTFCYICLPKYSIWAHFGQHLCLISSHLTEQY